MLFIGIDIGTQGVRAVAADEVGRIAAEADRHFSCLNAALADDRKEQVADDWREAMCKALTKLTAALREEGVLREITSVAIDGTSGTILPVDGAGRPLMNALMYNDARSKKQAAALSELTGDFRREYGYSIGTSFAVPKIMWIKQCCPEVAEKTAMYIHQSDYAVGTLTGEFGTTDYSNALKTGYDTGRGKWADFLGPAGIDEKELPRVVSPGTQIGTVTKEAAEKTGLPEGTPVVAGATDGYSSSLAAGIAVPGDWATVLGTTIVLKGISEKLAVDPEGRVYSHKHPEGWWLPGGASNVGGRCLNEKFPRERWAELNRYVDEVTPTGILSYPLTMTGERFPYIAPEAEGVFPGSGDERRDYAALMEGVGYTERLCYDVLSELGCNVSDTIMTSGGACRSEEWLRVRANILGKRLLVPKEVDASMGSAMIAASAKFGRLSQAVKSMVVISKEIEPDIAKARIYDDLYAHFKKMCEGIFGGQK